MGGKAHRDLKLENILVADQFVVKVADLGFAKNLEGNYGDGLLFSTLGSEGY